MNALLLLDGEAPGMALAHDAAASADYIVCADGAANWALPMGLRIDAVIGDMDSIDVRHLRALEACEMHISPREKDETDGQLALDAAIARGAEHITILGGTGGRADHFGGNVQLLVRAQMRGVTAEMRDDKQCLRALTKGAHIITGAGFSLLPLGTDVFINDLSGAAYPLHQAILPLDTPLGISNHVMGKTATLAIERGWVLLVLLNE